MIRIDARILNEEAFLRLDTLPRRLRDSLRTKLYGVMEEAEGRMLSETPGRFLDPQYVVSGVDDIGSLLVGYVEAYDKPGFIPEFVPKKSAVMRFISKSGELVHTKRVYRHPYPKGGPVVERFFRVHKPWLLDQVEYAAFDVVYNNAR